MGPPAGPGRRGRPTGNRSVTAMELGIHLPSATDFPAAIRQIPAFEEAGADVVWLGESYGYDAVSALGALTATTTSIRLALGVVPVQSRSASLLAMTAAGIDALSGGRAVLGLGASGPQVIEGWHDLSFGFPVARTRRTIERCRAIWRSEPVGTDRLQPDGSPYRSLKIIHRPVRDRIPIFLGALGEASTRLAAEVADGWFAAFFWPERSADVWGEALADGRSRRAGDLGPLDIAVSAPLAIGRGIERAMDDHRARLAHYIGGMGTRRVNFYNRLTAEYGFGDAADRILDLYLAGDRAGAIRQLPAELVHQTCLIGDEADVADRLQAYQAAGVTILNLAPHGESLADKVQQLSRLRTLGTA